MVGARRHEGRRPDCRQALLVFRKLAELHSKKENYNEVKITGPQLDENIVADIVAGDAEAGDEVRDR